MDKEEKELQDSPEPEAGPTNTPEEEPEEEPKEESLTPEQIADLQKKAEASSQNFERLKKEERKRKELEDEMSSLKARLENPDDWGSDDDLRKQINELSGKLRSMEEKEQWSSVTTQFPILKEKQEDFEEFRDEYKDLPLDKVAKLFVVEKDLYESAPKRKGLEKAKGGTRNVPSGKMSHEDVARLRKNNYREYTKLLKAGKIQVND